MHQVLQEYNRILGVKEIQTREQLKHAYRRRAKFLHPDSSSTSASHEQFLLLQQAYDFYSRAFDGTLVLEPKEVSKSNKYPGHYSHDPAHDLLRNDAKKRAAERARMKKENFESKGYYKTLDKMYYIINFVRAIQALALLIGLPVFLFYQDGIRGLLCVLIVQGFTYPLWSPYLGIIFQKRRRNHRVRYF